MSGIARAALAALLMGMVLPAHAADSAYTRILLGDCAVIAQPIEAEDGPTWQCAGYGGLPVVMVEGDLRWFVAYGIGAENHRAMSQTLGPFNDAFRNNDTANPMVIEWRLDDQRRPYAAIQRFYTEGGSHLVVTRLFPADSCRVAEIDAAQIPDANVLARQFADQSLQFTACPPAPQQFP